MILPTGVKTFSEALQAGAEVYHNLKSIIKKKYGQVRSSSLPACPQTCMSSFLLERGGLAACYCLTVSAALRKGAFSWGLGCLVSG